MSLQIMLRGVYQSRSNTTIKPEVNGAEVWPESVHENWKKKSLDYMLILMFKSEAHF